MEHRNVAGMKGWTFSFISTEMYLAVCGWQLDSSWLGAALVKFGGGVGFPGKGVVLLSSGAALPVTG